MGVISVRVLCTPMHSSGGGMWCTAAILILAVWDTGRAAVAGTARSSLKLEIMITSQWHNFERREQQRRALRACLQSLDEKHEIEMLFFMGDLNGTGFEEVDANWEPRQYDDIVLIGGPDGDPPVERDETYVLDRPCARTYRLAHGTAWLAKHRAEVDYV